MNILIVEDERRLAEAVEQILKKQNYHVDMVHDGEDGLYYSMSDIYDLILLDIMLPKMDGLNLLKRIRKAGINTPVILLTAKGEVADKVLGLDSGADDYLAKPFDSEELLARIRANSRRKGIILQEDTLTIGDIELDKSKLKLTKGEREIKLTLKESELLGLLIIRRTITSSKELIIEKLWGFDSEAEYNHVEVYISFLRKKLSVLKSSVTINTVRGVGYILEESKDV